MSHIIIKDRYETKRYLFNGKCHREDGPAVIYSTGRKEWWINGKCHREDGPAVIYSDGYTEWWFNGIHVTDKVIIWANERNIDLDNMSEMDKVILKTEMKINN